MTGVTGVIYGVAAPVPPVPGRRPPATRTTADRPGSAAHVPPSAARPPPPGPMVGDASAAADRGRSPAGGTAAAAATRSRRATSPGYGFDQCQRPTQRRWTPGCRPRRSSRSASTSPAPRAACRDQPNLTPTWISTQLAKGWRLLPITLGPQASCNPRFPRYGTRPGDQPDAAAPAASTPRPPRRAPPRRRRRSPPRRRSGIVRGQHALVRPRGLRRHQHRAAASRRCAFLSAWTKQLHALGYVSGVYSSAGSGIKMLDDARVERPGDVRTCPTRSGSRAGTARPTPPRRTSATTAGCPGGRMKQYQGGHDETWGGVTINIDRNYLDLGTARPRRAETPLRRRRRSTSATTRAVTRRASDAGAGQGAAVPAHGAEGVRRQDQRHVRRQDARRGRGPGRAATACRPARRSHARPG